MSARPEGFAPAAPTLASLQRQFAAALLVEISPFAASQPAASPGLASMAGDLGIDNELLDIHRQTVIGTLLTALSLNYPTVQALVGADFFEALAREFMQRQPPSRACLNDYGQLFPEFLGDFPAANTLVYLADVARLDRAVSRALHAPDSPALALGTLAQLEPADMGRVCFEPHPALTLLELGFEAEAIRRAVLEDDAAALAALDVSQRPTRLLVERTAAGTQVRTIDPGAAEFLRRLCGGEPLQSAVSAFGDAAAADEIQAALVDHLKAGRFVAWRLDERADADPNSDDPVEQKVSVS